MSQIPWGTVVIVPLLTVVVSEARYWIRPITTRLMARLGITPGNGLPPHDGE